MRNFFTVLFIFVVIVSFSGLAAAKTNLNKSDWIKAESASVKNQKATVPDQVYLWFGHGDDGNGNGQYRIYYFLENMPMGGQVQLFVNKEYIGEVTAVKTRLPKKASSNTVFLMPVDNINGDIVITEPGVYDLDIKVVYPGKESDWLSQTITATPFNVWTASCFDKGNGTYILTYRINPHFGITFDEGDIMNVDIYGVGLYDAVVGLEELDSWNEGLEYFAKITIGQKEYKQLLNNSRYTNFEIGKYNTESWTSVWE